MAVELGAMVSGGTEARRVDRDARSPPAARDCGPRTCLHCGAPFRAYSRLHRYCSDYCGKLARHIREGHPPRVRRRRYAGTCAWCGGPMLADDGHPRTYHRTCFDDAQSSRAAARHAAFAQALEARQSVTSEMTMASTLRVVSVEGQEFEVIWAGDVVRNGVRGGWWR